MESPVPPLLMLVGWSVVLLVAHVMLQGWTATRALGLEWNAGPRDDARAPGDALAGRAARASSNFRETYPAFVGLALALVLAGRADGAAYGGALVWFVARLAYVPLYLAGVRYVRSVVWLVSLAGLGIMLASLVL